MKWFLVSLAVLLNCSQYISPQWVEYNAVKADESPHQWDSGAIHYDTVIQERPSQETGYGGGVQVDKAVCQGAAVVFVRRMDGSVDFNRPWSEYREGFGNPNGEFWLGLTTLHRITTQHRYLLQVDLVDFSGERKWAEYGHFSVGPESDNFRLSLYGYNALSTAGDSMTGLRTFNGMEFSTYDRENDRSSTTDCAGRYKGGWWYNNCHQANPVGLYRQAGYKGWEGIAWLSAYNDWRSFKAITLRLVPV